MRPVSVIDTAERVRTLSLPGYTDGAWGYDPTDRCYVAELWLDGTPTDRRPTFRLTADTPSSSASSSPNSLSAAGPRCGPR